jgi:hypothetical protein
MNWAWEYKLFPSWSYFLCLNGSAYQLHRTRRTVSGYELSYDYAVEPSNPLYDWLQGQEWPISPGGDRITIDIAEFAPIPKRWLRFLGINKYHHYTERTLRRLYVKLGFKQVEVFAYGQTYDIVNNAKVGDAVKPLSNCLAEAEAELSFRLSMGAGPWLFLVATK